jgi:hypothetical protein
VRRFSLAVPKRVRRRYRPMRGNKAPWSRPRIRWRRFKEAFEDAEEKIEKATEQAERKLC